MEVLDLYLLFRRSVNVFANRALLSLFFKKLLIQELCWIESLNPEFPFTILWNFSFDTGFAKYLSTFFHITICIFFAVYFLIAFFADDLSAASTNSGMLLNEVLPRQPGGTVSTMQPACTTPPRQPAGAMLANTTPPGQPVGAMLASMMSPRQPDGAVAQGQLANTTPPRQPPSTVPPVQPPCSVLKALGQLEFRKAFLVLSYAGRWAMVAVFGNFPFILFWKTYPH